MHGSWPVPSEDDWARLDKIKLPTIIEREIADDGDWAGQGFTRSWEPGGEDPGQQYIMEEPDESVLMHIVCPPRPGLLP